MSDSENIPLTERQQYWLKHIRACEASGQTTIDYARTAMRMVVEAYPADSITSFKISLIKHPWSKKSTSVGGRRYNLSEIKKENLLARFNDPCIIFCGQLCGGQLSRSYP